MILKATNKPLVDVTRFHRLPSVDLKVVACLDPEITFRASCHSRVLLSSGSHVGENRRRSGKGGQIAEHGPWVCMAIRCLPGVAVWRAHDPALKPRSFDYAQIVDVGFHVKYFCAKRL